MGENTTYEPLNTLTSEARSVISAFIEVLLTIEYFDTTHKEKIARSALMQLFEIYLARCKWLTAVYFDEKEAETMAVTVTNKSDKVQGHAIVKIEFHPLGLTPIKTLDEMLMPF